MNTEDSSSYGAEIICGLLINGDKKLPRNAKY